MSLISFGFFGSLSHLFNLLLIVLISFHYFSQSEKIKLSNRSKILFFAISSAFFIFMIRSFFYANTSTSLISLSPMLPIPIIGLTILLQNNDDFRISSKSLAFFSKIAILVSFLVYLGVLTIFGKDSSWANNYINGGLELFSGNPIPFSLASLGVSVFCLSNWTYTNFNQKLTAIIFFLLGIYLAGVLSDTRGTLLSILVSTPIIFWLLSSSISTFIILTIVSVFSISILCLVTTFDILTIPYLERIINGLQPIFLNNGLDSSINQRLQMWDASIQTIRNLPFFGHDISNRFDAISPFLPDSFDYNFTHPHNDIFAGIVGAGFLGGIATLISILSPLWAALLSDQERKLRLLLAIPIVISILLTSNVNTVFFNDISAGWLAFSTLLIWNLKVRNQATNN